jgi:hypothetical protein
VATAPQEPSKATAAYGNVSPALIEASSINAGNVGNRGELWSASAASPIVVAQSQGIANHESPPMMYPGKAWTGDAAI